MIIFALLLILINWRIAQQLQAKQLHGERIAVLVLTCIAVIISCLLACGVKIPPIFTLMNQLFGGR